MQRKGAVMVSDRKILILIVEDEEDIRTIVSEKLSDLGYQVFQARDGDEGFRMVQEFKPDLIISDVIMPKSDGNQFLKKVKALDFGRDIPFIVVTARGKMRDYFELVGVDCFFEKPFELSRLIEKIKDVLGKSLPGFQPPAPVASQQKSVAKADVAITAQDEAVIKNTSLDLDPDEKRLKEPEEGKKAELVAASMPKIDSQTAKKKVVVLEKEIAPYHVLQNVFLACDCAVELVLGYQECIKEAQRLKPDLIVLRNMPNFIDAEKLAGEIKSRMPLKDIPVIVYSGLTQKVSEGHGSSGGEILSAEGAEVVRIAKKILTGA